MTGDLKNINKKKLNPPSFAFADAKSNATSFFKGGIN
jgi:hypothetical protein